MTKVNERGLRSTEIRKNAEEALKGKTTDLKKLSSGDAQSLVHELEVHQIELKMQNEELRRAQKELEDARNRYSDLYDFAPIGYFTVDINGLILQANLTGAKKLGIERANLIKKPFSLYIAPENKDAFYVHLKDVFNTETRKTCELALVDNKGNIFNALLESMHVRDSDGNLLCRIAMGDIIQSKKAELQYKTILQTAMDGFYVIDTQGCILDVNDSYCSLIGYSREELLNMTLKDIDVIDTEEIIEKRIAQITKIGWARFETKHKCKDGRIVIIEASVQYLKEGNGLFYAFMRDITQRKLMESSLMESEERYRRLVDFSPYGIAIHSEGKLVYLNVAGTKILGSEEPSIFIGKPVMEIIHPDHHDIVRERIHIQEMGKAAPPVDEVFVSSDGTFVDVEITSIPFTYMGKLAMYGVFRDITERKKAENLHIENLRLEAADKAKSEFLANMSHELRTPLTTSIGFSELLKLGMAGELNEKQKHFAEIIYKSNQFLLALINDILDISKIEAGKIELVHAKMSVPETINETLSLIKERAMDHKVRLKTELDQELDFIEADKQKIKQVLFNLISNAVKFSKEEGGTVTITAKKEGDLAQISVSDTGIGIREENVGKLFSKFEQLERGISDKYGGTGLGLAISKQLVELHGGRIWAQSKYGEGTTFTFILPIKTKNIKGK